MRSASPRSPGAETAAGGSEESPAPRRSGPARNPLRRVRQAIVGLLAVLAAALAYAILDRSRRPDPPPLAALATNEGVAQRAINLEATRTRRGLPALKVAAKEAFTYDEGRTELHDVAVTIFGASEGQTSVLAPLAVSQTDAAGGWTFRNGVEVRTEDGLQLLVPELKYRESPPEASAAGPVSFARGAISGTALGLRYLAARRRLDLLSDVRITDASPQSTIRRIEAASATLEPEVSRISFHRYRAESETGQTLSGIDLRLLFDEQEEAARIKKLEATGGFETAAPGGDPNSPRGFLGSGAGSLSGGTMEIAFAASGLADEIRMNGSVKASLEEPGGGSRKLEAERLRIEFDSSGRPARIRAEDRAKLDSPSTRAGAAAQAVLRADVIDSTLDPKTGDLSALKASGDASIEDGERRLRAGTIRYDVASGAWFLDGTDSAPARAAGYGMTISSAKMEIQRLEGRLEAAGDVKTTATPQAKKSPAAGPAGSFFGGEGPVHGMSDTLQVGEGGKEASYRGRVRLWREGTSIEASEVDLDQETGALQARGGVVARIPSRAGAGQVAQTITVSAARMIYDRALQKAVFTTSSKVVAGDMRIDSDSLEIRAGEDGSARDLLAKGGVKLTQATRLGTCDELSADIPSQKYVLRGRGRVATIQDKPSQQVAKGTVLTFEGSTDRILVESETGGRTWITLAPRPGLGKKSDPEPPR